MEDGTVTAVARRLGRTNAQVLIRWSLQQGFICLPKSSDPERQQANLDVFSFELSSEDMKVSLSPGHSTAVMTSGEHPDGELPDER